jgi:hypothetical protein
MSCLYWIVTFYHVLLNIINNQLWRIRQAGHVECTRKEKKIHTVLVERKDTVLNI